MRYLPLTDADRTAMLDTIGAGSLADLYKDVPKDALDKAFKDGAINLPDHQGELDVLRDMQNIACKNMSAGSAPCFLGAGAYRHYVPASLDYLIQRGEFLTAYTPYQPEVSQGTLQVLFEFQTQVANLFGMEVANASMYDGATACAEAVTMACRVRKKKNKVVLSGRLHPHYVETTKCFTQFLGIECVTLPPDPVFVEDMMSQVDDNTACVVVQYPDFYGGIYDYREMVKACHEKKVLVIFAVPEPLAMGAIVSPGDMGADIVVGEGLSLAAGLNFGAPGVGLFATKEKFLRQMPGRVAGKTTDTEGREGYVLTLSTREQHIRREKATSNICTNSGLMATAFSIHMSLLGEKGFTGLAELNHAKAVQFAEMLEDIVGLSIVSPAFFNEFAVMVGTDAAKLVDKLAEQNVLIGVPASRFYRQLPELYSVLLVSVTELNTEADMKAAAKALKDTLQELVP